MLYDQQIINFDQYKVYQINYIQLSYRTPEKFELQKHICSSFQKFIPDNIELRLKIPSVRIYLDICRISIKNFSPIQRLTKDLLPFENSPAVSYENMNQFRIFSCFSAFFDKPKPFNILYREPPRSDTNCEKLILNILWVFNKLLWSFMGSRLLSLWSRILL